MSKNLPAKYFQENKERLKKQKAGKDGNNMVVSITKICQKMKSKCLPSIGKNVINQKKCYFIIIRKYFNVESFASL